MGKASIIKSQVESVLDRVPEARNSDRLLIVKVLKEFYGVQAIEDIIKPSIPSVESIRRWRQFIQAEGKYPADVTVTHRRKTLEERYRVEFKS